jgi:hypothetical protein
MLVAHHVPHAGESALHQVAEDRRRVRGDLTRAGR